MPRKGEQDEPAWETPEMRQIEAAARANGTWLKAPNGQLTMRMPPIADS